LIKKPRLVIDQDYNVLGYGKFEDRNQKSHFLNGIHWS